MTSGVSVPCPEVGQATPNKEHKYQVTKADLPLHCPMDGMSLWNSHPRVFVPMEGGKGKCPYCGAEFEVKE